MDFSSSCTWVLLGVFFFKPLIIIVEWPLMNYITYSIILSRIIFDFQCDFAHF